jgi:hypothetical protein
MLTEMAAGRASGDRHAPRICQSDATSIASELTRNESYIDAVLRLSCFKHF